MTSTATSTTSDLSTPVSLARRRVAVCFTFALLGLVVGGWVSRIPDIKHHVGLNEAGWGSLSISGSLGSLVAVLLGAALAGRIPPRQITLAAAPLALCAPLLLGLALNAAFLVPALLFFGFCTGSLSAPINALAATVERAYGRPIMATFHACFSIGTLAGGLLGALSAKIGMTATEQFGATSAVLAVGLVACRPFLPQDAAVAPGEKSLPVHKRWTPQLLLISAVAAFSSLSEGAASQWSAIYSRDFLHASSGTAALTYSAFALTMTLGRSTGDRVVGRLGRARFLRFSGVLAAAGLAGGLVTGTVLGAILGFALMGAGMSCVIPTAYAAAGNQADLPAAQGVSTVVTTAWPAFLIGPPTIGWIAQATNLRIALLCVVVAPLAVAVLGGRVRAQRVVAAA